MSSMPPPPPEMPPPPPPPPYGGPPTGAPYGGYGAPYGAPVPVGPAGGAVFARWWQRGLAIVIDYVLLVMFSFLTSGLTGTKVVRNTGVGASGFTVHTGAGGVVLPFVAWMLYAGLLNGVRGQTVGKMVMGIKVVRKDTGAPIGPALGLARAVVHYVLWVLCVLPGVLDSLAPLWDRSRQTWHDKVGSSVVVRAR